jgi:RNA polymerase sigma factor (sigma-70 family)
MQNDDVLIKKIKKENCSICLQELQNKHNGLCNKILNKYCKVLMNTGIPIEDIQNDITYVVYKSALSFNIKKKIKFSTWLGNQMRYFCLNSINKNNRHLSLSDDKIIYLIEKNQKPTDSFQKEQVEFIFDLLDQMQDSRVKEIFKLRYFDSNKLKSWNEIGKKLKISTQTAINIHNKSLKFINNKISSKNSFDKI